jgi:hypothetical protein
MRVSVQDDDALCSVLPLDAATYLRTRGWSEVRREQHRYSLWNRQDDRGIFEALLPLEHQFRDYKVRIAEMLSTLEIVERRSKIEILRDMMTTSSDVIRIRTEHDSKENSIPLESGVALVKNARDLLLAAACSTVALRTYFPTRKPDEALKYLSNLRMGQTERGSFVITLLSPVTPDLKALEYSDSTDPFERRVTKTLMRALAALRDAAEQSAATGSIEPFETAISFGVSVNLCDALANLQEETRADKLDIGISWAPVRAVHESTIQNRVTITKDAVPVMREASRFFKSVAAQEGVSLRGFITELHREPQGEGSVLIAGIVEGLLRNVRVTLPSSDYDRAILAHRDMIPVRCEGDLIREGRGYKLRNPRGFAIEAGDD